MQRAMMRPPGFPVVPFVFPMGLALALLGVSAWYSYLNWRELEAIRRTEQSRAPGAETFGRAGEFGGTAI